MRCHYLTQTAAIRHKLERRVEADFVRDYGVLQRQLNYLNTTIAAWEEDWTRASSRPRPRRHTTPFRGTRPF